MGAQTDIGTERDSVSTVGRVRLGHIPPLAFGFANPILVDATNPIITGHGRVEAAKLLGMEQVPTIRIESLSPEQIRIYAIADNKLAENAGSEKSILAIPFCI